MKDHQNPSEFLVNLLSNPIESPVKAIACHCASSLHLPRSIYNRIQLEPVAELVGLHCIGPILPNLKNQQDCITQLVLYQ
jgi:hypothetical protein